MPLPRPLAFAFIAILAACDRDAPPAPTSAETVRLDEAEDMLNAAGDEGFGNAEGAAPSGTAPSNLD